MEIRRIELLKRCWPALVALEGHYYRTGATDSAAEMTELVREVGAEMFADAEETTRYERFLSDAAAGDPGELEEHKYLLPRDEA